jgi:phosphopantothenoylcysteine synthetase/decarboxylase
MKIIVTLGPTQESLDAMRLISNRSTGDLGTKLALHLQKSGHHVIALRGIGATADQVELLTQCTRVIPFTTTEDLKTALESLSSEGHVDAIFHAAAVSDFYLPGAGIGKIPSREGSLTVTLEPTPKLLPRMRERFPNAWITGWKFEASGGRDAAIAAGRSQIASCHTDACVVNGPSYGEGFGVLSKSGELTHLADRTALCAHLTASLSAA